MFDDHWLLLPPAVTDDPLGTPRAFRTRTNLWRDEPAVDPVLRGLAHNPAAPTDVLLGLLGAHGDALSDAFNRRADLPPVVVEAMPRHPSAWVRAALAVNRYVDSAIRLRLVDDPDRRVVGALRADPDLALPDRVFTPEFDRVVQQFQRTLMTADELHCELIELMSKDRRSVPVAARHPEPRVRTAAVDRLGLLNEVKRDEVTQALLHDPVPEVRAAAVRYDVGLTRVHEPADLLSCNGYAYRGLLRERRLSRPLIAHVLAIDVDDRMGGVAAMAGNRTLPPDVLDTLFEHPSSDVRCSLAERDDLSRAQLTRLAADPDVAVRTAVSVHPRLTEDERVAIDIDVTTSREHRPVGRSSSRTGGTSTRGCGPPHCRRWSSRCGGPHRSTSCCAVVRRPTRGCPQISSRHSHTTPTSACGCSSPSITRPRRRRCCCAPFVSTAVAVGRGC